MRVANCHIRLLIREMSECGSACVWLQLVLSVATADMAAQNSNSTLLLPSTTYVISLADSHDRATFTAVPQMKEEPMDVDGLDLGSLDVRSCSLCLVALSLSSSSCPSVL